jgi:hypothetical protein
MPPVQFSTTVYDGSVPLAFGNVTTLPPRANYSLGSIYPTAQKIIRIRVVDTQGYSATEMRWTSPNENAPQILSLISQTRAQALERMTAGVFNWTFQVPVCSGCAPMSYGQFLNASMGACQCYIIPRLDLQIAASQGLSTFLSEARYLLTVPVYPRFQILSIDNWGSYCNVNYCGCSFAQSVFQPLYAMGWKGIGVLNGLPPYHPTCGWATYVTIDINKTTWQINTSFIDSVKADPTVQRILLYDPDFAGQALALQSTCGSGSNTTTLQGCNYLASAITYAAEEQSLYGYTYVYVIEQTWWDSTRMFISNGSSIYDVQLALLSKYN